MIPHSQCTNAIPTASSAISSPTKKPSSANLSARVPSHIRPAEAKPPRKPAAREVSPLTSPTVERIWRRATRLSPLGHAIPAQRLTPTVTGEIEAPVLQRYDSLSPPARQTSGKPYGRVLKFPVARRSMHLPPTLRHKRSRTHPTASTHLFPNTRHNNPSPRPSLSPPPNPQMAPQPL